MASVEAGLAVVIDLDYMHVPVEVCRSLWPLVTRAMLEAGFVLDGRVFVARNVPDAVQRARTVMKRLEPAFEAAGVSQFDAVRDFYCYDLGSRHDLSMEEAAAEIEVEEVLDYPLARSA